MDVIGAAASIAQLLGQAISLWQQISQARLAVRSAPLTLANTIKQLSSLLNTMEIVKREPKLHSPGVGDALELIHVLTLKLTGILQVMAALQRKSPVRQYFHALSQGGRAEFRLNDVLGQLERAKTDLSIRMSAIHVSMTGEVIDGIVRVEQEVQTVTESIDTTMGAHHHFVIERNEARDEANQLNAIIGIESSVVSATAKMMDNKALNKSRQRNILGAINRYQGDYKLD